MSYRTSFALRKWHPTSRATLPRFGSWSFSQRTEGTTAKETGTPRNIYPWVRKVFWYGFYSYCWWQTKAAARHLRVSFSTVLAAYLLIRATSSHQDPEGCGILHGNVLRWKPKRSRQIWSQRNKNITALRLSKLNDCLWTHCFSYSNDNYKRKYKRGRLFEMQWVTAENSCTKVQGVLYNFMHWWIFAERNRIPEALQL